MEVNLNELMSINNRIMNSNKNSAKNIQANSNKVSDSTGMNSLMFMGLNNLMSTPSLAPQYNAQSLAFKGMPNVKQMTKAGIVAAGLVLGAMGMTSCTKDTIYNEADTWQLDVAFTGEYNNTEWKAIYDQMCQYWQQQLAQQEITNEQMRSMMDMMLQMMAKMDQQGADAKDFYGQMFTFMTTITSNQDAMIQLLEKSGKTEDEAKALLEQLINEVKEGKKDAAQAMQELMAQLGDITALLSNMNTTLQSLSSQFNNFYNDYLADKKEQFRYLSEILEENKIQTEYLKSMNNTQDSIKINLEGLKANTDSLYAIVSDDDRYQEFLDVLVDIKNNTEGSGNVTSPFDYNRLQQMFDALGLTITQALNTSQEDMKALVEEFKNTYIANEQKQSEKMDTIIEKLDAIANFTNLDLSGIENAIKGVTDAVNQGNEQTGAKLDEILAAIKAIEGKIDSMLSSIGDLSGEVSQMHQDFNSKWEQTLSKLTSMDANLESVKNTLTQVEQDMKNVNTSLETLNSTVNELKTTINNFIEEVGASSITKEELESMWKAHDEENYNKYKALIDGLGIGDEFNTLEELLTAMSSKLDYLNQNNQILQQILDKLNEIDASTPDYMSKLEEILQAIKDFECNCKCGSPNEGVYGVGGLG